MKGEPSARVRALVGLQQCEGACVGHSGAVAAYLVTGYTQWGWFAYCDAAVEFDRKSGLVVMPESLDDNDDSGN